MASSVKREKLKKKITCIDKFILVYDMNENFLVSDEGGGAKMYWFQLSLGLFSGDGWSYVHAHTHTQNTHAYTHLAHAHETTSKSSSVAPTCFFKGEDGFGGLIAFVLYWSPIIYKIVLEERNNLYFIFMCLSNFHLFIQGSSFVIF